MKNKVSKIKRLITLTIPSFLFVVISGVSFGLMKQTLNSRLDSFANKFNDYYKNNFVGRETAPIIRIQSKIKNSLQDLYENFYYTNSSTVNYSFRQFYPGNSTFTSYYGTDYSICFNKQRGFTIHDKHDYGYYLDNGLFSTYFKDEVLPNKGYWQRREGANGVCFISDTLADKLVVEYGIVPMVTDDNRDEAYKALIKPEEFYTGEAVFKPTLGLKIDGEDKDITFSINNILYSDERTGPRVQQLYGDFCVMFGDPFTDNQLRYCTEYDMKNDIYGNTTFLKRTNALGYNKTNAIFSFYKYNYAKNEYQEIPELKELFENIDFNQSDTIYYLMSSLLSMFFLCFIFFIKKHVMFNLLLISCTFLVFNILLYFFFVDPICNLFIVINYLVVLILNLSRVIKSIAKEIVKNNRMRKYEEINI